MSSTQEEALKNAKKTYDEVYEISTSSGLCYVRPLTLNEYNSLGKMDPIDAEDHIFELTVIWPENFRPLAGEVSSIAEEVIDVSGLSDVKTAKALLHKKRQQVQEVQSMMYAYVMATQSYTVEQLGDLTFAQLVYRVALAEKIFEIQEAAFDPTIQLTFDLTDPEEVMENDYDDQLEEFAKLQRGRYNNPDNPSTLGTATVDDPIAQQLKQALG